MTEFVQKIQRGYYEKCENDNEKFLEFQENMKKEFDLQNNEKGDMIFVCAYDWAKGKTKKDVYDAMDYICKLFQPVKSYFENGEKHDIFDWNQADRTTSPR